VIAYSAVIPYQEYVVDGYSIQAIPVDHTVPAVGYRVIFGGRTLVYTGDTGPTEEIWKLCSGVDALIVEVSFPNAMESLALLTKHLTSAMLLKELDKIEVMPGRILITHPKPQYYDTIRREIESLQLDGIELLHDGSVYEI
jgi:ribonuclease BN (tRNA processing enzyme)